MLRSSWTRKGAIYKVSPSEHPDLDEDRADDIMYELEPATSFDDFETTPPPAPVLCLVGPGKSKDHPEGCPHRLAWKRYRDEL